MGTRILSALVALPGTLFLIHLGGWAFMALLVAVVLVCSYELAEMTVPGDRPHAVVLVLACEGVLFASQMGQLATPSGLAFAGLGVVLVLWFFLFRLASVESSAQRMGALFLGVAWVGGLCSAIALLRQLPDGAGWVLQACVFSWGSDTGAYFAGRFLGKRKLYEAVSPKKTWAGAVGGVVVAVPMALAFQHFFGPAVPPVELALVAAIGAAIGQTGDLAESLLKRSVGKKDSGSIMPGHGGLLDRIDALMFVAPVLLVYAIAFAGQRPAPL